MEPPRTATFLQRGTGHVAVLYRDDADGTWIVDVFRGFQDRSRMGAWTSRARAVEALERLQFAPTEDEVPAPQPPPTDGEMPASPRDVLVVDDDPATREALADVLRDGGFRVVTAKNGAEALVYLRATARLPCLILLDLMMPVMDGWTFRRELLAQEVLKSIPVVVVSAGKQLADAVEGLAVSGFLRKPVQLESLIAAVQSACS